jgi:hypothetical protein
MLAGQVIQGKDAILPFAQQFLVVRSVRGSQRGRFSFHFDDLFQPILGILIARVTPES